MDDQTLRACRLLALHRIEEAEEELIAALTALQELIDSRGAAAVEIRRVLEALDP
ncbi:MAG: hypothetical protein QM522_11490 [Chitinophagaceae bacterium]|nr:hypothetical protein [Chitinophagaceae bacterium]